MVDSVLERKIRDVIEDTYNCKCLFKIQAKVVDSTYIVYLYIHGFEENPLHILWEGPTESDFLTWLALDLKKRNLIRSSHININIIHE